MIEEKTVQNDIVYLIYCALNGLKPDKDRVKKMDVESLYEMSKAHSVTSIVYIGLESLDLINDTGRTERELEILSEWKHKKDHAMFVNAHMDIEREKIFEFMDQKGIWYLPLKGILLKELYPMPEMRQMGDNDILYDITYQQELHDFMVENEYTVEEYQESNHDVYSRKPFYNFEMHTSLFDQKCNAAWNKYYENIQSILIRDDDKSYGYHFNNEDFYIYFIIHMTKHFDDAGIGIRAITDCYLYVKTFGDTLNWEYIDSELKKLGIKENETKIRKISEKMFSDIDGLQNKELTAEEQALLKYIFCSGTFGGKSSKIAYNLAKIGGDNGQLSKKGKLRYIWKRIFPGKEFMRKRYPTAYKYKVLIPYVYVRRIFQGIFQKNRRKYLQEELDTVLKNNTGNGN